MAPRQTWYGVLLFVSSTRITHEIGLINKQNLVTELLLRYGANLKQRIVIGQKTIAAPNSTERASDFKTSVVEDRSASVRDILMELLGQEEAVSLISRAQAQQKSVSQHPVQQKPILSRMVAWLSGSKD